MSNQQIKRNVITLFQAEGYNLNSKFTQDKILREMNRLIQKQNNPAIRVLNADLADQLWQQCAKSDGEVTLGDYINIVVEAKIALEARIDETKTKIQQYNRQKSLKLKAGANNQIPAIQKQIYQNTLDLQGFEQDYNNIIVLSGNRNSQIRVSTTPANNRVAVNSRASINPLEDINNPGTNLLEPPGRQSLQTSMRKSQIFFKRSDKTLMLLLVLAISYLALELLIMNHRNDFLNLLICISLVAIYGLNYFDKYYIRLIMALILVSEALDIAWLALKAGPFWNPPAKSSNPQLIVGYLRFIVFFVVILMIVKVVIFFVLMSYMNIQQRTSINVCGYEINLTGEYEHNVISQLFPQTQPPVRTE